MGWLGEASDIVFEQGAAQSSQSASVSGGGRISLLSCPS